MTGSHVIGSGKSALAAAMKQRVVGVPPESPLHQVAAGDFSGLAQPFLVAAVCHEQLEDFVWREGLVCTEVRRMIGDRRRFADMPDGKILLLLPGWQTSPPTADLVEWWVNTLDRYTVELDGPVAPAARHRMLGAWLLLAAMAVAGGLTWLVVR